ncbi:MAG: FAD-dependent oxidoreductase [Proteobacteria bacterium]|nr:FAD-dependent oxidoreductase [Pseudomonadota bacterium]
MIETDILIIGGGAVGLSCLNQVPPHLNRILIEINPSFGQEASSRNSEVIHSGIYYPHRSLKTEHCKIGRNELYRFCQGNRIPHRQCGKYVIATNQKEEEKLAELVSHCEYEIVPFQRVGSDWLKRKLPFVKATAALFFPLSGVFDSHRYLQVLENKAREKGAVLSYRSEFIRVLDRDPWVVEVREREQIIQIRAKVLINSAGGKAAKISNNVLNTDVYEHRFCRGRYFGVKSFFQEPLQVLVYPVPEKDGLGIHLTPDLKGNARLGPDADWSSDLDCNWDELKPVFLNQTAKYLPELKPENLSPGFIGLRPKLFVRGEAHSDFLLEAHGKYLHLLGIESPGLTASLSLGAEVGRMIEKIM